jgi:alkylation response protein AidB-like acyl-CoA dehydrogenase
MDIDAIVDATGEAEFHDELRTWLDEHLPKGWGTPAFRLPRDATERREYLRGWQAEMAADNWVAINWPIEFGGRNASLAQQIVYNAELAERSVPPLPGHRGITIVGPTLIKHGTPDQQAKFLDRIRRADDLWSGGFSEPDAGSDLASLRTRGEVDGEQMIINGQKIWTSSAHFSDWIYVLLRTDPTAEKHHGISVVVMPLDTPGITIRPIRQMTGASGFNEVFFEDVTIPMTNLIGPLNQGWQVNRTTLAHEHFTNFIGAQVRYSRSLDQIMRLACETTSPTGTARAHDPLLRNRMARAWANGQLLMVNGMRNAVKLQAGDDPGPEGSIAKLFGQESEKELFQLAIDIAGPAGVLDRGALGTPEKGKWLYGYLGARAATIGGGTSEIHKNKIGEKVLGLPRDLWGDAEDVEP